MRKFKGYVSTNMVGSEREFEFEVEDDASEDEIEEAAREAMFDRLEWGFMEAGHEQ